MACIYGLVDPRSLEVRYVGMTKGDPQHRYNAHMVGAMEKSADGHKNNWIRQLAKLGHEPVLVILEQLASDEREEMIAAEREWIAKHKQTLTNMTPGGDGSAGVRWTDQQRAEHRQRMAEVNRRESKRQTSAAGGKKGGKAPCPPEARAKLSTTNTGKKNGPPSPETRAKISSARKGKPNHKSSCSCGFCTGKAGAEARWGRQKGDGAVADAEGGGRLA